MRKVSAFFAFFCFFPLIANAASFDCSAKLSTVEKLICSNQPLSDLDTALALAYTKAKTIAHNKDYLKKDQRSWIKEIRDSCNEANCLYIAYKERIRVLQGIVVSASTDPLADIEGTYLTPSRYCTQDDGEGNWERCPPTTADCLSIGRISVDTAHISVESYQIHGDRCYASGIAKITKAGTLEIVDPDDDHPDISTHHVSLDFFSDPIQFAGPSNACGARASWDAVTFSKKYRKADKILDCSDYQNPDIYLPDTSKK